MKEYAKGFYKSAAWKRARQQVITRSNGLCERCKARGIYKPGYIVHHKEYITPGNISNPNITLNLDNLEYVCEDCHNKEHKAVHTPMRYQYDANGNLLPPKENNKSDHTPGVQNLTPGKRTEGVTSKKLRKVARRIEKRGPYNGNRERFTEICKSPPLNPNLREIFTPIYRNYPLTH